MGERPLSNTIHMIGLGGAGSNIVEAFLKDEKTLSLLENDISRVSAMALDIADADIKSLQESHNDIQGLMKRKGIPQERLRVTARSIKFPSAEAMFDFVTEKYKEHLMNEGIEVDGARGGERASETGYGSRKARVD